MFYVRASAEHGIRHALMQKPSPGDGRGLRYVIRDRDAQVFFSIGQTLFSSGMKASAAGIVATSL
jgi:hypothetical protein